MAKRYTDTEKWDMGWFHALSKEHKLFWLYLQDKCNIGGIWNVNWPYVRHAVGLEPIKAEVYGTKVKVLDEGGDEERWFLTDFVLKQQSIQTLGDLSPSNLCHAAILKILYKDNIIGPSPLKGGYSNSNSKIQPYNLNSNGIKSNTYNSYNKVSGSVVRDDPPPTYDIGPAIDYSIEENFNGLLEEVKTYRTMKFNEDRLRTMLLGRGTPEVYVDRALERKF